MKKIDKLITFGQVMNVHFNKQIIKLKTKICEKNAECSSIRVCIRVEFIILFKE